MKFFKPEDFEPIPGHVEDIASIANAKLEREGKVVYGKVSYVGVDSRVEGSIFEQCDRDNENHQALLVCIEPIEKSQSIFDKFKEYYDNGFISDESIEKFLKENNSITYSCTHPAEKVTESWETSAPSKTANASITYTKHIYKCECGARVRPKEFEETK